MSSRPRTAQERWKDFLSFVVVWSIAAIVGSALLIYFTSGSEPPTAAESAPEPAPVVLEAQSVPEPEAVAPEPPTDVVPQPTSSAEKVSSEPRRASSRPTRRRRMSDAERASKVNAHIRDAAAATEARDYDAAMRAYESALELNPNNFEVKILMTQVESLAELEASEAGPPQFRDSSTEVTGGTGSEALAAELIIEISPAAPNPGDPYILRVRARNLVARSLSLVSVELLDSHDSMKGERARASTPLAQQLGPNETALLWERKADWTRGDRTGTILVAVTLADGSRLSKSVTW